MSSLYPGFAQAFDTARTTTGPEHVAILLATFNGGEMLAAQLESIARQSHGDWSLIVSDDGSSDNTTQTIRAFADRQSINRVVLIRGPSQGSAQNFLSLLRAAGRTPFAAFADQDDVWFDDKLSRAIRDMRATSRPAIYGSSTLITDQDLRPLRTSIQFKRPTSFQNALVQNIAGGNTMVLNRKALDALQPASLVAKGIVSHDWWCYQMVTGMGGEMLYDPTPSLYYRQHGKNQIGANDTVPAQISRMKRLWRGDFARWRDAHCQALAAADKWLSDAARETLAHCDGLNSPRLWQRFRALRASGLYRQTRRGSAALRLAAVLGRL